MTTPHSARWTPERREAARQKALANPTRYWLGKKRGPTPQPVREKMSAATKGRRLSLGMTGRTHSADTRAKMRAAATGKTSSLKGQRLSAEWRAKLSEAKRGHQVSSATREKLRAAQLRIAKRGRAHHMWGRCPPHARRAEYNGTTLRSSYEVRFAKALDSHGIGWEYETRRFNLGTCTYAPDFYIPATGAFWEVKGWFNERSRERVLLFRERYPTVPLIVATNDVITMMERSA